MYWATSEAFEKFGLDVETEKFAGTDEAPVKKERKKKKMQPGR